MQRRGSMKWVVGSLAPWLIACPEPGAADPTLSETTTTASSTTGTSDAPPLPTGSESERHEAHRRGGRRGPAPVVEQDDGVEQAVAGVPQREAQLDRLAGLVSPEKGARARLDLRAVLDGYEAVARRLLRHHPRLQPGWFTPVPLTPASARLKRWDIALTGPDGTRIARTKAGQLVFTRLRRRSPGAS